MKSRPLLLVLSFATMLSACTSLPRHKKDELKEWRAQGLEVEEKNPTTAAVLNVLPGIGDFYNGNIGYGIGNLLLWPLSILWAPVGGASGAEEVNYYSTQQEVSKLEKSKQKVKDDLQNSLATNQINQKDFIYGARKLERMDLKDFRKPVDIHDLIPTPLTDRVPTGSN